jgi:hypothetical protein
MAHITLAGVLLDPTGEFSVGDRVRFTHQSTTGNTMRSAVSELIVPPNGAYSINLEYGLVLVEYNDYRLGQYRNLGVATVNATNTATSIPELLNALVPVSDAELIQFQAIQSNCVAAQNAAAASAAAALVSQNAAAASAATLDLINDPSQAYIFDTVALYQASTIVFPAGKTIHLNDRGADFTVIAGTGTANTFNVIASTSLNQSISIIKTSTMHANMFGAFQGDASTICTPAMQAYAAYCDANGVKFTVLSGANESDDYNVNAKIEFTTNVGVRGIGAYLPRFITEDTGLFKWPSGAKNVRVEFIRAGMAVRHTVAPNTHVALEFPGSAVSTPEGNHVKGCFLDGFGLCFNIEYAQTQNYSSNTLINCGTLVKARGTCINNKFVDNNPCTGDGVAFDIGDGTKSNEGWWINENLLDSFSSVGTLKGASFCKINDNIFDHIMGSTGLLLQGIAPIPTFGNHIKSNYFGFQGTASEGIRLLNNVASAERKANTIFDNELFAYTALGGTLAKGVLVDGSAEDKNKIIYNVIKADVADVDLKSTAQDAKVIGNDFQGAGFTTASACIYQNNTGAVLSSTAFLEVRVGNNNIEVRGINQPSSGTWKQGDKVWRDDAAMDGNSMILLGWIRLTTGSGHVAGTDWAGMRVSDVSPAN